MSYMKVPKQKVKVKIKTESSIIRGIVHTMVDGRLSDYITSHVNKFIPVTDAEIFYLVKAPDELKENKSDREVVFVNVEKIELIEYLK